MRSTGSRKKLAWESRGASLVVMVKASSPHTAGAATLPGDQPASQLLWLFLQEGWSFILGDTLASCVRPTLPCGYIIESFHISILPWFLHSQSHQSKLHIPICVNCLYCTRSLPPYCLMPNDRSHHRVTSLPFLYYLLPLQDFYSCRWLCPECFSL